MAKVPIRYVPTKLTKKDKLLVKQELNKSRKLYKRGIYYSRKKVKSFKNKKSNHILTAKKMYKLKKIMPNKELSEKTGCSVEALKKIENKGMGAYYSSGSRPNQTAQSWGLARLASAITGGKASAIDLDILQKGCSVRSKALRLAIKTKKQGMRRTPSILIGGKSNMMEKIISFQKSSNPDKKYMAIVQDLNTGKTRTIHFGASAYGQYKDRTPLKLYSNKNHSNKKRQMNYYSRHSHGITNRKKAINYEIKKSNGYYNAKILSHVYLWG